MPTGDSWPITCDAVGLRYCSEELKNTKLPSSPAVAIANSSSQRGWRNIVSGGSLPRTARIAPKPMAAMVKRYQTTVNGSITVNTSFIAIGNAPQQTAVVNAREIPTPTCCFVSISPSPTLTGQPPGSP